MAQKEAKDGAKQREIYDIVNTVSAIAKDAPAKDAKQKVRCVSPIADDVADVTKTHTVSDPRPILVKCQLCTEGVAKQCGECWTSFLCESCFLMEKHEGSEQCQKRKEARLRCTMERTDYAAVAYTSACNLTAVEMPHKNAPPHAMARLVATRNLSRLVEVAYLPVEANARPVVVASAELYVVPNGEPTERLTDSIVPKHCFGGFVTPLLTTEMRTRLETARHFVDIENFIEHYNEQAPLLANVRSVRYANGFCSMLTNKDIKKGEPLVFAHAPIHWVQLLASGTVTHQLLPRFVATMFLLATGVAFPLWLADSEIYFAALADGSICSCDEAFMPEEMVRYVKAMYQEKITCEMHVGMFTLVLTALVHTSCKLARREGAGAEVEAPDGDVQMIATMARFFIPEQIAFDHVLAITRELIAAEVQRPLPKGDVVLREEIAPFLRKPVAAEDAAAPTEPEPEAAK